MPIFVGHIVALPSDDQCGDTSQAVGNIAKSRMNIAIALATGERRVVFRETLNSPSYVRMLEMLRHARMPVYIETDKATGHINLLLVPSVFYVHAVADQPVGERLEVDLRVSHSRDFVAVTNPRYHQIAEALHAARAQKAPLLVTKRPGKPEIIDIQPATFPVSAFSGNFPIEPVMEPTAGIETTPVTSTVARQIFDLVQSQTCSTSSSGLACIPFLYPDQGCWARAHDMCRIMIANGVTPRKIWSYGQRHVSTRNSPTCEVEWKWHAAPILDDTVIDPSLFDGPVKLADWFARQPVDPPFSPDDFEFTDAAVYQTARISYNGSILYDPQYLSTFADLNLYRFQFANRCAITNPPGPPYDCA